MHNLTLGSLFDGSGGSPLGGLMSGITPVWACEIEPFPIRVTTKRLPFMKHYGDVSEMDGGKIEPVDIITFGSPCFPEGTLVLTEEGYLPIEEVTVGMKVLTHKGRWRTVTAAGAKFGETVVLKGNHYGLECTPNHPIYSSGERKIRPRLGNGKRGERIQLTDEKRWIPAGDMKNQLWAVPRFAEPLPVASPEYTCSHRQKIMPPLSEDLFYFIGRWLGDGWVCIGQRSGRPEGQRYGKIFLCDSEDKSEELRRIVEKMSGNYTVSCEKGVVRYSFVSQVFAEWLTDNFGRYAHGKTMPGWVFGLPEHFRQAILNGLLDSDGYRVKENHWRISTVSKRLAESVRLLAEIQGYSTTVFRFETAKTKVIEGRLVNQRDVYSVAITANGKRAHLTDGLHGWYRVRSVQPTGRTSVVYNITVDEDNSYVADGVVVHNCQDMSIAGRREGLEGSRSGLFYQAVRIIKEMRCATNGKYPRYIVWENVPGAFSSCKGEDFRCVLESICRIADETLSVPLAEKWLPAGNIVGDTFSVAWRVLDAQYWGVPQRRKRIFLVADFAAGSAGKILFESEGLSGYSAEGFRAWQGTAAAAEKGAGTAGAVCLNDQGGKRMDVSDVAATLRAETHGHPPCVAGFCTEQSAQSRGIGYEEGKSPTLRAGVVPAAVFENHSQDSRYTGPLDVAQTVSSTFGNGGNNQPFVVETPKTLKIRSGCEGGGKGALIQEDKSATLACHNDQTVFVPAVFGICSKESHAMLSDNPHSGFYEAETTRTLDGNGGNPSCNQGGMAVVAIEGNGARPSHRGRGYSDNEISFTLNTAEQHAVAQPVYHSSKNSFHTNFTSDNITDTLVATDYKDPPTVSEEPEYIVRRLTPTECARLQGFPDWWCDGLATEKPSDEELYFWYKVFETWRRVTNPGAKLKSSNQIRKWLADPHSDSAEYLMWGNGVALPCVAFVLSGIVYYSHQCGD